MPSNKLCIYHSNCADGFGAALAVYLSEDWGEETEFMPAQYGQPAPDVSGKDVIIVDFSYPRAELEKMHQQANSLLVIDHHKTAAKELEGLDYCIFNMERSGAMLAWQHLQPTWEMPDLIHYIQDRDLWTWALPGSKEVSAALASYPMTFEAWKPLLNDIRALREEGSAILRYQKQQVDRAIATWKKNPSFIWIPVDGEKVKVPVLNSTTLISEIGNELSQGHPFAATYFDVLKQGDSLLEGKRVFSLRKPGESPVDLGQIAKQEAHRLCIQYIDDGHYSSNDFSGGGHPAAAGFSAPIFCSIHCYQGQ